MTDDRSKPHRAQSQTERDLDGLEARALRESRAGAFGNPVYPGEEPGFTPVQGVLRSFDDPELQRLIVAVWAHTANQEQRYRALIAGSDSAQTRKELAELREEVATQIADIVGARGDNGKVGRLRDAINVVAEKISTLNSRAWWFITAAAGGLGFLMVKLVIVTRAFDAVENQAANSAAQIQLLEQVVFLRSQSQPATAPEKVSP